MGEKKKKSSLKYIILAVFLIVVCLTYAFDYIRCTTYFLEVTVSNDKPYASTEDTVDIMVRVTRFGKPMAGDKIFALPTSGTLNKNVFETDEEGYVYMVFTPYNDSALIPAVPVTITIRDESNSVIWEVNSVTYVTLDLQPTVAAEAA